MASPANFLPLIDLGQPSPFPPPWASAWGDDQFGLWAEFSLHEGQVVQRMRWIEPGEFLMGAPIDEENSYDDEKPQHRVTIRLGFWLADTACTQAMWQVLMGGNPSHFDERRKGGAMHPVECVSWLMVQEFLRKLQQGLLACRATLPTEAEWEYACRAGSKTPFSFGATISTQQVNYNGNHPYGAGKKGEYRERTVAVKALPANTWGLYQMHGNVWEWCADTMRTYRDEAVSDPGLEQVWAEVVDAGAARVLRGGSWISDAQDARSAVRDVGLPGGRDFYTGFRFALRATSQAGGV